MILVFALYALLASTFTIGKMLLFYLPPLYLIAIRMIIAGSLTLAGYYLFVSKKQSFRSTDWAMFVLISLIHMFIPYTSEFFALQNVAPSCAALMYNLSPFFTAFFSYFLFGERMTLLKWIGFGLGFCGILYFVSPTIWCFDSSFDMSYILLFVSVMSAALGWVVVRYFVKARNFSILFINGIAMLLASVQSFAFSRAVEGQVVLPWGHMHNFLFLLVTIILIANIIFYNLYGYLLKKYTATFLSFVGFVTPLFTAFYDWLFLGQMIDIRFFVTVGIVGCGIYLFYKEELKQGYVLS